MLLAFEGGAFLCTPFFVDCNYLLTIVHKDACLQLVTLNSKGLQKITQVYKLSYSSKTIDGYISD